MEGIYEENHVRDISAMLSPEIEDYQALESHFTRDDDRFSSTNVDYLEVCSATGITTWKEHANDEDLAAIVSGISSAQQQQQQQKDERQDVVLRVFFIPITKHHWYKTTEHIGITRKSVKLLREKAGLSNALVSAMYTSGQWSTLGDWRSIVRDHDGVVRRIELCWRPISGWEASYGLIQVTITPECTTYFCINYSNAGKQRLKHLLSSPQRARQHARRPFLVESLAADEVVKEWAKILDKHRLMLIAGIEKSSMIRQVTERKVNLDTKTQDLHDLSRTWHILLQDLDDTRSSIRFLQESYGVVSTCLPAVMDAYEKQQPLSTTTTTNTSHIESLKTSTLDSLRFLESRLAAFHGWAGNYRDRTNIQINLLFHLSSQLESRTNTRIADQTAKLARLTQRDSASSITIAAVTMFFLPGTFVSAILSTTFFDFGPSSLQVSDQWWVFLAVTVPLTIVVFATWYAWRRWRILSDSGVFGEDGREQDVEHEAEAGDGDGGSGREGERKRERNRKRSTMMLGREEDGNVVARIWHAIAGSTNRDGSAGTSSGTGGSKVGGKQL